MDLHNELRKMILLIWVIGAIIAAAAQVVDVKPGCPEKCGNVSIPYPFGTKDGCYLNRNFFINCSETSNPPTPIHGRNIRVLSISVDRHELRVNLRVAKDCYNSTGFDADKSTYGNAYNYIFPFSNTRNKFVAIGCDTFARIFGKGQNNVTTGCLSVCDSEESVPDDGSCSGIGCCQTSIPKEILNYNVNVSSFNKHSGILDFNPCSYSFLAEEESFKFSKDYLKDFNKSRFPVVLEWDVGKQKCQEAKKNATAFACKSNNSTCYDPDNGPGYRCNCSAGYQGNPYLPDGCKDINECAVQELNNCQQLQYCVNTMGGYKCQCPKGYSGSGTEEEGCVADQSLVIKITVGSSLGGGLFLLLLCGFGFWMNKFIKKRRIQKLKQKFFKRNGGLLLQQQISSDEGKVVEKTIVFTSKELEKATDNFNENRILGQGGQGTVYKGMLSDGKILAIKKSKVVDESQLEQFINEVVILSQINHRNIVKLLGCCLETDVPLLVYEFISNGNLFELIHDQNEEFPFSWKMRIQVATEVAGAVAYLHSASSMPIFHRDIKSTNILLDEKYRAKVSDFGTSRSIAIDQTHLTTLVRGTFGYLDPEYFQSSQFTEKSDVYSFGVVLVELLTGQKAISFIKSEEERSLVTRFILCLKEMRLFDLLDARVAQEATKEEIVLVADIARRCLSLNGKKRPTMKEVMMELEGIRMTHMPMVATQSFKENECIIDMEELAINPSSHSGLVYHRAFSTEIDPLLFNTL